MLRKRLDRRIVRYVLVGGGAYAIELDCLLALHYVVGLSVVAATAIAFWIGLALSFFLQKLLAFKDYQKEVRVISRQIIGYSALVLFNYLFTLVVVGLLPARYVVLSRTLALIITTVWNYTIYKILFKQLQP